MARKTVMEVSAHLEKHEAVCTERWLETIHRIKRLEFFVIATLVPPTIEAEPEPAAEAKDEAEGESATTEGEDKKEGVATEAKEGTEESKPPKKEDSK